MRSLRLRLLAWLLPPLVVVGAVAAAGAYVFMDRRLTAAYDQDLGDIARALVPYIRVQGQEVTLDFTRQADAILRADSQDKIYYAIVDPSGRLVAGDAAIPAPPLPIGDSPMFWNDERNRQPIRVEASSSNGAVMTIELLSGTSSRPRPDSSAV